MLEHSILGKPYRFWEHSLIFTLLQRLCHPVLELLRRSRIVQLIFREGALEAAYRRSATARVIQGISDGVLGWLRRCTALVAAGEHSGILRTARGSVLRGLVSFEGLFGLFLLVMFATPHAYWNNLYTVLAAFAFLLFYLLLAAAGRRSFLPPTALGLGACVFLLALLLSLGFTAALRDSIRILLFFLASLSLCYVIAADFREPARLRKLLAFLYAALLLVGLYAIAQRALGLVRVNASLTDLDLNRNMPGRAYSTLDNPVNLSEFVLLFLPLGAAFAAGAKRPIAQLALAAGLVFPAVALVLTYCRGGWLAIVLAAAVFVYFSNKRLLPVLALLGVLALPLLPATVAARLATIGNAKDTSTIHRLDIWRGVLRMLGDHGRFLTGIGLGPDSFRYYYDFYSQGIAQVGAYHAQQHYLELLLETGLPGLLAFLYLMVKYAGRAVGAMAAASRETRYLLIACVSSLAALAFVGMIEYLWFYQRIMFAFFIFLGILLAAAASAGRETQ